MISKKVFDEFDDKKQCLDSKVGNFVNLAAFHQTNKNIPWQRYIDTEVLHVYWVSLKFLLW